MRQHPVLSKQGHDVRDRAQRREIEVGALKLGCRDAQGLTQRLAQLESHADPRQLVEGVGA